jgi:hypothetical protein
MKKIAVKLFIAGFSLALFVGCASSSTGLEAGNAHINRTILAAEELFPPFNAKAIKTNRFIAYSNVSLADTDKIKQSLKAKKFSLKGNSYHKEITYQGVSYVAVAKIDFIKVIENYKVVLSISTENEDVSVDMFDDIFGYINGKFSHTEVDKIYDKDIASYLDMYNLMLRDKYGFEEDHGVSLVKNDGSFFYLWGGLAYPDNVIIIWDVEALP